MRSYLISLVAIISATAIFQLSNGVLTSLIPIRLGTAEIGDFATSSVATAFSLGFLIGCLRAVRVVQTVGYIRAFAGPEVTFAWQGGEPTMLGVDFFRRVVELQREFSDGRPIHNTRAYVLDDRPS